MFVGEEQALMYGQWLVWHAFREMAVRPRAEAAA